jgi:hypothetical protein
VVNRLAVAGLGLAPWLWLGVGCAGLAWFGITYGNVVWLPLLQREVPGRLLGRVSAVDWVLSLALAPVGTIAGGALAGLAGVRLTLVVAGSTAAATGSVLLLPGVTGPDRRRPAELMP